ncbi:MAG TPA: MauE/DoxX family redox-associated membrane protein [Streptosporangiaceae bacterium]|nr:MauE/DoxX family redox-associated membrane protein [Streptosporangiaceae bacterium]
MPGPWALQLSGAVCCSAVVLALAGAAKIWRGSPDSAIRRVLRVGPARWRLTECAFGVLECATGIAVCTGSAPRVAGSVMAVLGTLFVGLLAAARRRRAPGGCGCLPWHRTGEAVTWRAIARAGCVLAAGVADLTATPNGLRQAGHAWFGVGALIAALAYTLLSMQLPVRTPRCHRSLWFPVRDAFSALTSNAIFSAFLDSHGPTGAPSYQRDGCTDQFSFSVPAVSEGPSQELIFDVSRGPGGTVAVRAAVRARERPATGRTVHLPATSRPRWSSKEMGDKRTELEETGAS